MRFVARCATWIMHVEQIAALQNAEPWQARMMNVVSLAFPLIFWGLLQVIKVVTP